MATKKGMAAALAMAAHGSSELVAYSLDRLSSAAGGLLQRAAAAGDIRADIDPEDLLRTLIGMCYVRDRPDWQAKVLRLVDVFIDGLRRPADQTQASLSAAISPSSRGLLDLPRRCVIVGTLWSPLSRPRPDVQAPRLNPGRLSPALASDRPRFPPAPTSCKIHWRARLITVFARFVGSNHPFATSDVCQLYDLNCHSVPIEPDGSVRTRHAAKHGDTYVEAGLTR